jgi:heme/copper-type cytochrome/quinol oxidase subunit 2
LRRFGWSLIAASVLLPLTRLVLWLVIAGTAPGPESGLGGVILTMLVALGVIFGLVFVVFAAILREASRLAEENAGFI